LGSRSTLLQYSLDSSLLFCSTSRHHRILLTTYCLPFIGLRNIPNHHTFTLKMAAAMFAKSLDNSQHSLWLDPLSWSYTVLFCLTSSALDQLSTMLFVMSPRNCYTSWSTMMAVRPWTGHYTLPPHFTQHSPVGSAGYRTEALLRCHCRCTHRYHQLGWMESFCIFQMKSQSFFLNMFTIFDQLYDFHCLLLPSPNVSQAFQFRPCKNSMVCLRRIFENAKTFRSTQYIILYECHALICGSIPSRLQLDKDLLHSQFWLQSIMPRW
jgi:hypothetical protein